MANSLIKGQMTKHITGDLTGVVCQPSGMANSFISQMASSLISSSTRRRKFSAASARVHIRASVFCLLPFVFCPLMAEELPDPTRPPTRISTPVIGGRPEAMENQSSGLHTIIISEKRRAAIIDGQTVELWGEHGGAKLVEVNEGSVVLQRAQRQQVLTLFPDVKLTRKKSKEYQVNQPSSASKAQSRHQKEKK